MSWHAILSMNQKELKEAMEWFNAKEAVRKAAERWKKENDENAEVK